LQLVVLYYRNFEQAFETEMEYKGPSVLTYLILEKRRFQLIGLEVMINFGAFYALQAVI